jgi:hypothetical protein
MRLRLVAPYMPECAEPCAICNGDSEGVFEHLSPLTGTSLYSARRGLRRDVDGPIHRLMWPRSAPGRRANGSRSRRPGVTVAGETSAMTWNWRPPKRLKADRKGASPSGKPKFHSGTEIAARGCRKATPGAVRPLGASDGSPRRPARVSWGSDEEPRGCRVGTRVPVAPPAVRRGRAARGREKEIRGIGSCPMPQYGARQSQETKRRTA